MALKRAGVVGSAVGAVALGMLLMRGSAPGPGAPASPTKTHKIERAAKVQPPAVAPEPLPEDGPWQASRDHFAGVRAGGCASLQDANGRWCVPDHEKVQAMIAIVPDPVNTHMALVFDRALEAIQLAAESMNYVADRYWLPWDPSAKLDWQDYDSQQKAEEDAENNQKEPGLLMFRWNGDADPRKTSALYVFVVSETPTAGVDGNQFSRAVEYHNVLCSQGECAPPSVDAGRIRILGPTFSGSLASLVRLTRSSGGAPRFKAYSGTVSSICAMQNQHLAGGSDLCGPVSGPLNDQLTLQTFVSSTESSIQEFLQSLTAHDIDCAGAPQVALLFETATSYGAAKSFTPKEKANAEDEDEKGGRREDVIAKCATSFSYPREISSLRNAYQSSSPGSGVVGPYLSFSLADREPNKSDEPPDFSKPQGPLSKEAVLMKLAGELKRNQYKYIGVSGSNVLDVLFLTSFLHSACPDARLFIPNADLLLDRTLDSAPYIGTLSLATYPLVARNLDWTSQYANLSRLPFPDQFEEGQYNAFLATFQEVVPAQNAPSLRELTLPFHPKAVFIPGVSTPPLWLTVVGSGGYWPVRLLRAEDSVPAEPALKREDFSSGWKIMLTLLCAIALLHIYTLETVSPISKRFRDFALVTPMPAQRLLFIHLASAALAVALGIMVLPVWIFGWEAGAHMELAGLRVWLLALTGTFLAAALPFVCWRLHGAHLFREKWMRHAGKEEEHEIAPWALAFANKWLRIKSEGKALRDTVWMRGVRVVGILVWSGSLILVFTWLRLFHDGPDHYGFFFAYRSLYLATGVSPFIPMLPLLATLYCWSILEVWRLRFNDRLRPMLHPKKIQSGDPAEQSIAGAVSRFFLGHQYVLAFLVIFYCWLVLFDPAHPFQSFENRSFSWVYAVLFSIGVGMMLSCGLRLWEIWSNLRDLLQQLERTPLRLAFSRLKGFSWSPIWRQGGQEADWINMSRSFEALRQINNCDEAKSGAVTEADKALGMNGDVDAMQKKAGGILPLVHEARRREVICTLQRCLSEYKNSLKLPRPQQETEESRDGKALAKRPLVDLFCEIEERFTDIQQGLATVLQRVMDKLHDEWGKRCLTLVEDEESGESPVVVVREPDKPSREERQLQELEEYAALRHVAFIRGVLTHMRYLMIFLATSFSLVLLSLNIYSFEPHQALIWSFTAIFCLVGLMIVTVLAQVHKDRVLSRVTGTKPNELGLQFYLRIVSFGAVPLLTFLATHFPAIGHYLVSFLQPGLESLK